MFIRDKTYCTLYLYPDMLTVAIIPELNSSIKGLAMSSQSDRSKQTVPAQNLETLTWAVGLFSDK